MPGFLSRDSCQGMEAGVVISESTFGSLFLSLSGAVQIGQPKNLIWTGVSLQRQDANSQFSCELFKPGRGVTTAITPRQGERVASAGVFHSPRKRHCPRWGR